MKAPRLLLFFFILVFGMAQGQHLDLGYGVTSSNFSYRSNSSPKPVFQAGNGQSVQLHYADEWIRDLIDFHGPMQRAPNFRVTWYCLTAKP